MTCLGKLEEQLNVDVDYMDPEWIIDMASKYNFRFHDQTSNQIFVDIQLNHPSNQELLATTAMELKGQGWLAIYSRMAVLMCQKNIDAISGRVLVQTLPSKSYDIDATLAHARLYDTEFAKAGISRDRFCIKIPSTGPALSAAKTLQSEGIQTLGTALFSVPQAIACSQAGCLYISPYFNELPAHTDRAVWPDLKDPAIEHPMAPRLVQIIDTYKKLYKETGRQQPLVKNASFISLQEVMAAGEMGCHSAAVPFGLLEALAATPHDPTSHPGGAGTPKPAKDRYYQDATPVPERLQPLLAVDPLSNGPWVQSASEPSIDFLADNGAQLQSYITSDKATKKRLDDALQIFTAAENSSKDKIEAVMATL